MQFKEHSNSIIKVVKFPTNLNRCEIQRPVDIKRCSNMYNNMVSEYENGQLFLGMFTIVVFKNKNYLIDGQHRFYAVKKLMSKFDMSDLKVVINYIYVKSYSDIMKHFCRINNNVKVKSFYLDDSPFKCMIKDATLMLCDIYPNIINDSKVKRSRYNRPYIKRSILNESLYDLFNMCENVTIDHIIKFINICNDEIKNNFDHYCEKYNTPKTAINMYGSNKSYSYIGIETNSKIHNVLNSMFSKQKSNLNIESTS